MRYSILIALTAALTGCANGPHAYVDLTTEWHDEQGEHYGTAEAGVFLNRNVYIYGAHRSCVPCRSGRNPGDHNAAGVGYRIEWGEGR